MSDRMKSCIWVTMQLLLDIFPYTHLFHTQSIYQTPVIFHISRRIIYRVLLAKGDLPSQLPILPPDEFSRHTLYIDVRFPDRKNPELSWPDPDKVPPWSLDTSMANGFRCVFPGLDSWCWGPYRGTRETSSRANTKALKFRCRRTGEARYPLLEDIIWGHIRSAQVRGRLACCSDSRGSAALCGLQAFLHCSNMIFEMWVPTSQLACNPRALKGVRGCIVCLVHIQSPNVSRKGNESVDAERLRT